MFGGDEDGLARDAVHIDACTRLEVVEMDEAVLGDKVDDTVLFRHLHGDGEVIRCLRREVDINVLLRKRRIRRLVIDLDNVQLTQRACIQLLPARIDSRE